MALCKVVLSPGTILYIRFHLCLLLGSKLGTETLPMDPLTNNLHLSINKTILVLTHRDHLAHR